MTSSVKYGYAQLALVGLPFQRILRTGMSASSQQNLPWSRLVLIVAAVTASVSVGMSVFKREQAPPPPALEQQASEIDKMIAALEQRLQQDPSSVEGWRLLGMANFQAGRYTNSVRAYRRATHLQPDQAEFWSALGEALVMADGRGFPEEARTAFNKALAIDAKDARARFFLGTAKVAQGNAEGAIEDWFALLKDAPAGAPWAAPVKQRIEEVAKVYKIDITKRLDALSPVGTGADTGR
jgi:cytochrome c-type biogenesis protein CcmH